MKRLLGNYLKTLRGSEGCLKFSRRIGLSNTLVLEIELGNRLPSDEVLPSLAEPLQVDYRRLFLYAYCDRSPALRGALQTGGWAEWLPSISAFQEGESAPGGTPELAAAHESQLDRSAVRHVLP